MISSQNSPVRPTGQIQDITTKVETISEVSSEVGSGAIHSPPLAQRQSMIDGVSVELVFFVSCTKNVTLAYKVMAHDKSL